MRRRFLYVLFAALAVLFAGQATAADVATLIRALGDGGFDEREKAIVELAASGDPRAPIVLEALNAGVLHLRKADGAVLIVRKARRRTSGTASRSAPCCCWRPSASPSPSA
jgi:urea transport system permease protein